MLSFVQNNVIICCRFWNWSL